MPVAPSEVDPRELVSVTGERVRLPEPDHLVHLQFRRFAGCPVCNLHLRSFARRHAEITASGVRELVVFHSSAEELRPHATELPFSLIADPDKRYYREFGVEAAPRALLDPRAWGSIVCGGALTLARRFRPPAQRQENGRLGLPADFLVDPTGRVLASRYGAHADDQWSVDELLTHVREGTTR